MILQLRKCRLKKVDELEKGDSVPPVQKSSESSDMEGSTDSIPLVPAKEMTEEAEAEKAAQEKAAQEKAEKAAQEKAAQEKAAKEKAAKERAAKRKADRLES